MVFANVLINIFTTTTQCVLEVQFMVKHAQARLSVYQQLLVFHVLFQILVHPTLYANVHRHDIMT